MLDRGHATQVRQPIDTTIGRHVDTNRQQNNRYDANTLQNIVHWSRESQFLGLFLMFLLRRRLRLMLYLHFHCVFQSLLSLSASSKWLNRFEPMNRQQLAFIRSELALIWLISINNDIETYLFAWNIQDFLLEDIRWCNVSSCSKDARRSKLMDGIKYYDKRQRNPSINNFIYRQNYVPPESNFLKFIEAATQLTKSEFWRTGRALNEDLLLKIANIWQLPFYVAKRKNNKTFLEIS